MENRFRSLRIIGTILKILAWVTLVGGIIFAILLLVGGVAGGLLGAPTAGGGDAGASLGALGALGALGGLVGAISAGIGALLGFLAFYAYGDAIYLALAIEENTRETSHYLKGGDSLVRRA